MRRHPSLAVALATLLVAAGLTLTLPPPPAEAAGTPPACTFTNSFQRRCNRYTNVGAVGSIGLVGDSVLLGSADGMSTPGLPAMLAGKGWGPVNLIATLGMRTRSTDNNLSGQYWVKRWHDNGFHPDVIAVNLGANHLGSWNSPVCTPTNTAPCLTQINYMLDHLALYHPTAKIWWAKVNHEPFGQGNGFSLGMLGWNAALDQAAGSRPHMVVWDWPTALATANPAILMDTARVHPSSGTQYVKRSTMMEAHITDQMGVATFVGPRAPVPPAAGSAMGYEPVAPTVAFDSGVLPQPVLPANTVTEVDLSALAPEGTAAADVILQTHSSSGGGWLTVWRCADPRPTVSSLNYTVANAPRTAQALVRLDDDRSFCVYNSAATAVKVFLSGVFTPTATQLFSGIAPQRPLDTRSSGKAARLTVTVPTAASVAVTVTVTGGSSGGSVVLRRCDDTGVDLPVLSFQANEVVAGAAFAAEWTPGTICLTVNANDPASLPHVIVDVTGTLSTSGALAFVPTSATRLLDTRSLLGGWRGRHGSGQVIDVVAAPPGAKAASGTITIVRPMFRGWLTAFACGQPLPPTSSVNAAPGIVMANSVTVGINESNQTMCIRAAHSTHTLFDVVGWWVTATS